MKTLLIILFVIASMCSCTVSNQVSKNVELLEKSDLKQCYNLSSKQIKKLVKTEVLAVHYVKAFGSVAERFEIVKPDECPPQIVWVDKSERPTIWEQLRK